MVHTQESEESVTIEQLGDRRQSILETVRALGGEANAAKIRSRADVPEGSFGYHFDRLKKWSLLEDIGRERVGGGDDAIVWSLTEDGKQLLETIDAELGRDDRPQTFEELNERIDELESEVEELKEVVRVLGDHVKNRNRST